MSKALECLKKIENEYSIDESVFYKEDFKQVRMELEALEIIKEKLVDVFKLYNCKTVEEYNQAQYRDCMLTKEEFNLLKEVLEWFLKFGHW